MFYLEQLYIPNVRTLPLWRFNVTLQETAVEQWHLLSERNILKNVVWTVLRSKIKWRWQVSWWCNWLLCFLFSESKYKSFLTDFFILLHKYYRSPNSLLHSDSKMLQDWLNFSHFYTFLSTQIVWLGWESIEPTLLYLYMWISFWKIRKHYQYLVKVLFFEILILDGLRT